MMQTIVDTALEISPQDQWKIDAFEPELSYVSDEYKNLAKWLIAQLPDYFFVVPASSTGKYHPAYTNGKGGLLRHTKAAVRIAIELMRLEMYQYFQAEKDRILIALMVHDGWKHGPQTEDGSYRQYTDQSHSKICFNWLVGLSNSCYSISEDLLRIADLVLTHMGQWNINGHTGEIFAPKPQTQAQCFVHLCDYLASRKCLEVNFDASFGA